MKYAHGGHDWPEDLKAELPLLSPLLIEFMLIVANMTDVIRGVEVNRNFAVVWRGYHPLPADGGQHGWPEACSVNVAAGLSSSLEETVTSTPSQQSRTLSPESFRGLMRQHAAAVTVVTAPGSPPVGFTATSFTSVSLDPPMVSFCLARSASAWPTVMVAETIAVHVLGQEHEAAARAFATHGIDRFAAHGAWHAGPNGVPLLDGFLIRMTCRVVTRVDAGDHTIVLASPEVGEQGTGEATAPLVYHAGTYVGVGRIEAPQVW